jgi:hypothetical protein
VANETLSETRQKFEAIWQRLLEELNTPCDCPGEFFGAGGDAVYRTQHNESCKFRQILKEASDDGRLQGLEEAAKIAEEIGPISGYRAAEAIREKANEK